MTNTKELFEQGKLSAAVEQLTQEVKAKPTDVANRIFLFELLCFTGDLERAEKQLDVVRHQSTEMMVGVEVYRQLLRAEMKRREVFAEGKLPDFLTTPPEYVPFHLEALQQQREGKSGKARVLLEKALLIQPAQSGQLDGQAFEEFEDSDPFLGPFLELIVNDKYAWLPFEQISRIEIAKPEQLRDLIWVRAKAEARGGDIGHVFLPVLYPGTSDQADESIKLGRITNWLDVGEGLARGVGQRVFLVDGQERGMLEMREIIFSSDSEKKA